jgi:hypothetical protein
MFHPVRDRAVGDSGQVVPLAAALMVLTVAALVALVPAAEALADRARASTAADAAALAGAAEGEDAARRLAAANGAELVEFRREGEEVVVRVRVGMVQAEARARGRRVVPDVASIAYGRFDHRRRLAPSTAWCDGPGGRGSVPDSGHTP